MSAPPPPPPLSLSLSLSFSHLSLVVFAIQEFQSAKDEAVSFLDKVSTTVRGAASTVLLKQQDPEFASLQGYFSALEKNLGEFESTGVTIMRERAGVYGRSIVQD